MMMMAMRVKVKGKEKVLKVEMLTAQLLHKVFRQELLQVQMLFSVMMNLLSHPILMMMNLMLERQMSRRLKTSNSLKISLREDQLQQLLLQQQRELTLHLRPCNGLSEQEQNQGEAVQVEEDSSTLTQRVLGDLLLLGQLPLLQLQLQNQSRWQLRAPLSLEHSVLWSGRLPTC